MKNNNDYGLLPFIREDIYGLTPDVAQIYGWEIKKFNIEHEWRFSQGKNIVIAVIDTGCDLEHKDIKNNLVDGKNFVEKGSAPVDRNGHGTHVSGTIAAENNGVGMVGLAPKAKIMPLKALNDQGGGNIQDIVDAIFWAADHKVDFITMSLGSPYPSDDLQKAIKYAADKGSVIFCAAGNSGPKSDIAYPAKYDHTIAIGAIDINLRRTSFTCSGETLDFLAPGHDILSCVPGNQYALMSGTSMSNPFAVGCAALLLSYARQTNFHELPNRLKTVNDYIEIFKQKTQNLSDPTYANHKKYQGYGIMYPYHYR
jgi:subtilisin family serine protease